MSTGGALNVTVYYKIKCLKFSCFFFGNPTNKTVIGTTYTWELLIANHLEPIVAIDQSEILNRTQVQFITLFFGGAQNLYQPRQAGGIWC